MHAVVGRSGSAPSVFGTFEDGESEVERDVECDLRGEILEVGGPQKRHEKHPKHRCKNLEPSDLCKVSQLRQNISQRMLQIHKRM